MTEQLHSDSVFHSRAIRELSTPLENDPDVMVHQQLARLRFFERELGVRGKRVLDFGCGSGFNCNELKEAKEVLGFDISADAIALAKASFPDCSFYVADACSPQLSFGKWERVLCCEVLEHVPDMEAFLDNLSRHLELGGKAFISTPNRDVFSLGHEPSPMNREHIKESNREEFDALLKPRFKSIQVYGQRFKRTELLAQWKEDVQLKITALNAGTRWKEPALSLAQRNSLIRSVYNISFVNRIWKWLRWSVIGGMQTRAEGRNRPYDFRDFEFTKDTTDAVWFCAIVGN